MKLLTYTLFSSAILCSASQAFCEDIYVPHLTPIKQELLPNSKTYEGCGPIAAAMLLGYYQTEHNLSLLEDSFNGTQKPYESIKEIYKTLKTKPSPTFPRSSSFRSSYTLPGDLKQGLKDILLANGYGYKYKVNSVSFNRKWKTKLKAIKSSLKQGNPLIALIRNIPPCISGKNSPTKFIWHYIVLNGIDFSNKSIYLLDGYFQGTKNDTSSPDKHRRSNSRYSGPIACTFDEVKNSNLGLFYFTKI